MWYIYFKRFFTGITSFNSLPALNLSTSFATKVSEGCSFYNDSVFLSLLKDWFLLSMLPWFLSFIDSIAISPLFLRLNILFYLVFPSETLRSWLIFYNSKDWSWRGFWFLKWFLSPIGLGNPWVLYPIFALISATITLFWASKIASYFSCSSST